VAVLPKIDMERETATRRLSPKQERVARAWEILAGLPQTGGIADLAEAILAELKADAQT
jgi:hypothetical protein